MRDEVLEGPTPAEVVALVRMAEQGSGVPPHLTLSLVAKGWIIIAVDGVALLTIAGRVLVDRAKSVDLELMAGVSPALAAWSPTPAA